MKDEAVQPRTDREPFDAAARAFADMKVPTFPVGLAENVRRAIEVPDEGPRDRLARAMKRMSETIARNDRIDAAQVNSAQRERLRRIVGPGPRLPEPLRLPPQPASSKDIRALGEVLVAVHEVLRDDSAWARDLAQRSGKRERWMLAFTSLTALVATLALLDIKLL